MAADLFEFFGYSPSDQSPAAGDVRRALACPFVKGECTKKLRDGAPSGGCTVKPVNGQPVIICPKRLYAEDYRILRDIAEVCFPPGLDLIDGDKAAFHGKPCVAVFGHGRGRELRLPRRQGSTGGYFVDWILAQVDGSGGLVQFVAVEVQSIDTTGTYRPQRDALLAGGGMVRTTAGLNWENVHKRILPQLLYKGNVLRREEKCTKGLFFVCPGPVYLSFENRLGGRPQEYPLQSGAVSFRWYDPGVDNGAGTIRELEFGGQVTTTLEQIASAIAGSQGLPPAGTYETAITAALNRD